ncbi:MAG: AMP-binding protein, partial [Colwellia sp.]
MSLQNQDIKISQVTADKVVDEIKKMTAKEGSFEVVNKVRNDIEYNVFKTLPTNLGAMYKMAADNYADEDFIIYKNERHSFKHFYQQACVFATLLQDDFSIQAGDKVVIAMRNYPEWIVAFMGITLMGGVAVPLNAWWQE